MRRPLFNSLLLLLAIYLAAVLPTRGPDRPQFDSLSGREVELLGETADIYEPADQTQDGISFTLKHIRILSYPETNLPEENTLSAIESILEKQNSAVICYPVGGMTKMPRMGSTVKVRGTVKPFAKASNPGEFDAFCYYENRGTLFSLRNAEIIMESKKYDRTDELLRQAVHFTDVLYVKTLGREDGGIASAMVLGVKKGMSPETKALYQGAGISHLLAISGLHISMIGLGLFSLLKAAGLPLCPAALLASSFLLLYGKMTGMSVSTLRAILMFLLMLAAKLLKRTPDTPTSLMAAACLILTGRPRLLYDAGFQLSFSAVAGAAVFVPVLKERGPRRPPDSGTKRLFMLKEKLYEGFAASLGITLAMLPFLLVNYYEWNPWSLVINLAVIPLMGVLLSLLLLLAALGLLLYRLPIAGPCCFAVSLPVKGIFFLYHKISLLAVSLPGSSLHAGMPQLWQLMLFMSGLALFLIFGRRLRPLMRHTAALLLTLLFMIRLPGYMEVTMLDVGQGTAIFFQTPDHRAWLMDAGSTSVRHAGKYQIVPFLKYKGVRSLEGIFISHWDEDHVNGLEEVLEWAKAGHVKIKRLLLPDTTLADQELLKLLALAERYHIKTERIGAGQIMRDNGLKITCLHPYRGEAVTGRNNTSVVLRLEWKDFAALLTGDLEGEGEDWLVREKPGLLGCDLLETGHHGSATSSSDRFLQMAAPAVALISCGENNRYGHPAPETLDRLSKNNASCYITAIEGAITVLVKRNKMEVTAFGKGIDTDGG